MLSAQDMEPHGQARACALKCFGTEAWYLHEIPTYAKASAGYPPGAKSAEARRLRHMED
jgi:hypothetical protein